jgi:hypothetical protein
LNFPSKVPEEVMTFARKIFEEFNVPFISLDIGFDGSKCFLFEFQFVLFGQYAVEQSQWHFVFNGKWNQIKERTTPEKEFVLSIHNYIQKAGKINVT